MARPNLPAGQLNATLPLALAPAKMLDGMDQILKVRQGVGD